jgi:hypothetical protein
MHRRMIFDLTNTIRRKRVFISLAAALLLGPLAVCAQDGYSYKHAIGGRFGVANGITYKTFLTDEQALDFILNFRSNRNYNVFRLVGLYLIHNPITQMDGLRWYYGVGGGVGGYRNKFYDQNGRFTGDESSLALSVDGAIGLDYKFINAPINVSLDWKPALELAPDAGLKFDGIGLSVRFTF